MPFRNPAPFQWLKNGEKWSIYRFGSHSVPYLRVEKNIYRFDQQSSVEEDAAFARALLIDTGDILRTCITKTQAANDLEAT